VIKFIQQGGWIIPVVFAVGWFHSTIKAAEQRGKDLAAIEVLRVDRDLLTSQVNDWRTSESALREHIATLRLTRDSLRGITQQATVRALESKSKLDSALSAVPDTVRVQVFDVIQRFEDQFEACNAELGNCEERLNLVQESRDSALSLLPRLDSLSQRQSITIEGLTKRLRPSFVRSAFPWAVAAAFAGLFVLK